MLYFKYLHLRGPGQTMQLQLIRLDCQFGLVFKILPCLLLQEHQSAVQSADSATGCFPKHFLCRHQYRVEGQFCAITMNYTQLCCFFALPKTKLKLYWTDTGNSLLKCPLLTTNTKT